MAPENAFALSAKPPCQFFDFGLFSGDRHPLTAKLVEHVFAGRPKKRSRPSGSGDRDMNICALKAVEQHSTDDLAIPLDAKGGVWRAQTKPEPFGNEAGYRLAGYDTASAVCHSSSISISSTSIGAIEPLVTW